MIKATQKPTLVIVGTGMAGAKVVEEVLNRDKNRFAIRMFGAEPHGTYNRILLSTVLGGFQDPSRLWLNPREWYEDRGVELHAGIKVEEIEPKKRVVTGAGGKVTEPYDILVLATGSKPFVPPMQGIDKKGVFVFRTIEDCNNIGAYAADSDRAVVLGGGLLGLEAARGLLSFGLEVTVVEMAPHLMPQQLDAQGGKILQRKMEKLGVEVVLGAKASEVLGEGAVHGIRLDDGTVIDTDMLVVSCGIRPNVDEARSAGLHVDRAIVVDDQLHTSEEGIFAVGECAQHRGKVYGLVDPIYEQARVLADVLIGDKSGSSYKGSRLATTLKVMGVDLVSLGDATSTRSDCEAISHYDPEKGIYKKIVLRERRLQGAILLGTPDVGGRLTRKFKEEEIISESPLDLLMEPNSRDALLESSGDGEMLNLTEDTQICNCHEVCKAKIVEAIQSGKHSVAAIGEFTRAGTGCGTCQPLLDQLIGAYAPEAAKVTAAKKNKVELMKERNQGINTLEQVRPLMPVNNWKELTDDQKQMLKWQGLFYRKPTPGNFMLRIRFNGGQTNSKQFQVLADLCDEFGKGFCDLTTRQQIQLRWFTLADVEEIWKRLAEVGLHSKQTGMDNIRGVCGCPVAGITQHELLDATSVVNDYTDIFVDNEEFTNLPRKFNVTITGCMENCCHTETQDVAMVPAYRDLDGEKVNGFNVYVGGKQGSGGFIPATPLDAFVPPDEAAQLCADITRVFRDNGSRTARNKARLAFLIQERGIGWFRSEVQKLQGKPLLKAGVDMRKSHHVDHVGIYPQKRSDLEHDEKLHFLGMIVPVGRITSMQMRKIAELADKYGNGDLRITVNQNLIIANVPENRIGALTNEPIFQELPYDPSPIMRGLVACTGNDYCAMAHIDTKGYAVDIAKELEKRTEGKKLKPLTIHWSGCPAGCGLHQVSSIGLQGCRSRVDGKVVDAAHVFINGRTGPDPVIATDLMCDVPISELTDALEPLVSYLPRLKK